jgi:hypothetical protein
MQNLEWRVHVPLAEAQMVGADDGNVARRLVVVNNYAGLHLPEAIKNPAVLLPVIRGGIKDVTAYYSRSRILSPEELEDRAEFDRIAELAAKKKGGLKLYIPGQQIPDTDEMYVDDKLGFDFIPDAMSICIWDSLQQAKAGSNTSAHANASRSDRIAAWYWGTGIQKYDAWTEFGDMPDGGEAEIMVFQSKPRQTAYLKLTA